MCKECVCGQQTGRSQCGCCYAFVHAVHVVYGFQANSYADVATALGVDDEDVEQWVVRGVTAGLVSAKNDKLVVL